MGTLFREKSDNNLLQLLREEKGNRISGGLYHELQVRMTYNSNHIEGSKLTEEQTRLIFETNTIDVCDGIPLHAEFEYIHPFQDGNGRVGRLVALKECLRHSLIPFIIEDSKKLFDYRGLSEWRNEKGWLTDTCLDGQDTFIRLLDMLDIPHR